MEPAKRRKASKGPVVDVEVAEHAHNLLVRDDWRWQVEHLANHGQELASIEHTVPPSAYSLEEGRKVLPADRMGRGGKHLPGGLQLCSRKELLGPSRWALGHH